MSATHAVSGFSRGPRRPVGILIARISEKAQRLWSPNWLPFRSNEAADELIVEHHGPVEIHQTLAGWSLETCIEGRTRPSSRDRSSAPGQLCEWQKSKPGAATCHAPSRAGRGRRGPVVVSRRIAKRGQRVRGHLGAQRQDQTTRPRVGNARRDPRTGRPTKLAIHHAETAIRLAIASTRWQPTGGAMLRLHTLPRGAASPWPLEVAVPVAERTPNSAMPDWMRQVVFNHPAATQPAPPVR